MWKFTSQNTTKSNIVLHLMLYIVFQWISHKNQCLGYMLSLQLHKKGTNFKLIELCWIAYESCKTLRACTPVLLHLCKLQFDRLYSLTVFENNSKDASHTISYFADLTFSLVFVVQPFDTSHPTCLEEYRWFKRLAKVRRMHHLGLAFPQGSVLGHLLLHCLPVMWTIL